MNFKHWPYWVRGGILGLFFTILIVVAEIAQILWLDANVLSTPKWEILVASSLERVTGLTLITTGIWFGPHLTDLGTSIILVGPVVIGMFIGYLYGKFKNRKQLSINQ